MCMMTCLWSMSVLQHNWVQSYSSEIMDGWWTTIGNTSIIRDLGEREKFGIFDWEQDEFIKFTENS